LNHLWSSSTHVSPLDLRVPSFANVLEFENAGRHGSPSALLRLDFTPLIEVAFSPTEEDQVNRSHSGLPTISYPLSCTPNGTCGSVKRLKPCRARRAHVNDEGAPLSVTYLDLDQDFFLGAAGNTVWLLKGTISCTAAISAAGVGLHGLAPAIGPHNRR
jgi:hypothetical protein